MALRAIPATYKQLRTELLIELLKQYDPVFRIEVLRALKHAFNGALTPMVQCLLESDNVTREQLDELEKFIQKKRTKSKS